MKLRCLKDNFGDWIIIYGKPGKHKMVEAFTTFNQAKSKIWHILKCEECQEMYGLNQPLGTKDNG